MNAEADARLRQLAATAKTAGLGMAEKAQLAHCRARVEVAGGDLLAFDRRALRVAAGTGELADWLELYRQAGVEVVRATE